MKIQPLTTHPIVKLKPVKKDNNQQRKQEDPQQKQQQQTEQEDDPCIQHIDEII